jgi:histone demethylase JARID1
MFQVNVAIHRASETASPLPGLDCTADVGSDTSSKKKDPQAVSFREIIESSVASTPSTSTLSTQRRPKRKVAHAAVITSSPFKKDLEAAQELKNNKKQRLEEKLKKKNKKGAKEKKELSNRKTMETQVQKPQRKTRRSATKRQEKEKKEKTKYRPDVATNSSDVNQLNDAENCRCLYCGELYSESVDRWVCCDGGCNQWAHELCAGKDNDLSTFVCELCLE